MTARRVEIVAPVHNRKTETLQFLRSISRLKKADLDVHVIIVDDGSTDGTAEAIAESFSDVEIVHGDGNLWFTAGTNRGIEAALRHKPDFILTGNNDSIFDEMCLVQLVACADRHPGSVVGALLLDWTTPHKVFQVAPKWDLLKGGYRHWRKQTVWTVPNGAWEVELIVGNCVLFPKQAIHQAGLMDEDRLPQYGDAEYTPRMRRLGWKLLIEPRARVFCKPNDRLIEFRRRSYRRIFNEMFLNSTSPYSLRKRFYANLGGAPSKLQAILALGSFSIRHLLGRNLESDWALGEEEPPLSETFAAAIVDE